MTTPEVGAHGPDIGPDQHGPAGPAWTITRSGHTGWGWPWFVLRVRGGRTARVTVAGPSADEDTIREIIDARVARMRQVDQTATAIKGTLSALKDAAHELLQPPTTGG